MSAAGSDEVAARPAVNDSSWATRSTSAVTDPADAVAPSSTPVAQESGDEFEHLARQAPHGFERFDVGLVRIVLLEQQFGVPDEVVHRGAQLVAQLAGFLGGHAGGSTPKAAILPSRRGRSTGLVS